MPSASRMYLFDSRHFGVYFCVLWILGGEGSELEGWDPWGLDNGVWVVHHNNNKNISVGAWYMHSFGRQSSLEHLSALGAFLV